MPWADAQGLIQGRHRRPKPKKSEPEAAPKPLSVKADWLSHLVAKRRSETFVEPRPQQLVEQDAATRRQSDEAIVDLLAQNLDPAVLDPRATRDYLLRYGPFDLELASEVLGGMTERGHKDHHITLYLDAIRDHRLPALLVEDPLAAHAPARRRHV